MDIRPIIEGYNDIVDVYNDIVAKYEFCDCDFEQYASQNIRPAIYIDEKDFQMINLLGSSSTPTPYTKAEAWPKLVDCAKDLVTKIQERAPIAGGPKNSLVINGPIQLYDSTCSATGTGAVLDYRGYCSALDLTLRDTNDAIIEYRRLLPDI